MAIRFTGTGNGGARVYEVGQTYAIGNGTATAQRDGTFVNNQTGQVYQGSRDNPGVRWYASGNSVSELGGAAASLMSDSGPRVVYDTTGAFVGVTNQGAPRSIAGGGTAQAVQQAQRAALPGGNVPATGAAARGPGRGAATSIMFSDGRYTANVTDAAMGYNAWRGSPGWSDSEDIETMYSDVGAAVYSPFKFGADLGHNLALRTWGPGVKDMTPGDRVNDLGERLLNTGFGAWDAINQWGENQRTIDDAKAEARREVEDAWAARELLQAREAAKAEGRAITGGFF